MYIDDELRDMLGRSRTYYSASHTHDLYFRLDEPIECIENEVNRYIIFYEVSTILKYSLSWFGFGLIRLTIEYYCTKLEDQHKELRFRLFLEKNLEHLKGRVYGIGEDNAEDQITVASPHLVTLKEKRFFGMFYTKRYLYGVFYTVGLF